tara:strand:- start:434 stop:958 length:525 start_codon:yes stop_codon:yes gene_type:complete
MGLFKKAGESVQKINDIKLNSGKKELLKRIDSENEIIDQICGVFKVVFLCKNSLFIVHVGQFGEMAKIGIKQLKEIPLDSISSVEFNAGITVKLEIIQKSGQKDKIQVSGWSFKNSESFIKKVRNEIKKPMEVKMESQGVSIPDEIKKLSDLKDQGILSDEEFEAKKKDLLDKM